MLPLTLFAVFIGLSSSRILPDQIIGGTTAYIGQFPSQVMFRVSITSQTEQICGGTIIGDRWVLTAAHCPIVSGTQMIYGTTVPDDTKDYAQFGEVESFIPHPSFGQHGFEEDHDIAIVELEEPINFTRYRSYVGIAQLPISNQKFDEETGVVLGWGAYKDGDHVVDQVSRSLQYAQVPLISSGECEARWEKLPADYSNGFQVSGSQLCAGANWKGTGKGDSGGPLLIKHNGTWVLAGITSFGANAEPYYHDQGMAPGIYTRVASYCDFIKHNTQGEVTCSSRSISYIFSLIFMCIFLLFRL